MIKRVARIDASGVHLRGDNPAASTDARAFGPVARRERRVARRPALLASRPDRPDPAPTPD